MRAALRPLGHRIEIDGQPQPGEILQKRLIKQRLSISPLECGEVRQIVRRKVELPAIIDDAGQPAGNAESPLERLLAERELKDGFVLQPPRLPIAVGHRELVQVGQQGQRMVIQGQ
jgi:hypothetical protein